ncbi:DUF3300 domain-containing protein [Herbaspirillum sp. DW155]|uniref:DUF3300 domain-containing protein n=1 Tax=Herbaspirillum sp. DW155 TaxID=3095609 RepID=UPI00308C1BD7|nr:DUF3300 domain-containing protein [Herbaspirillum sp. DW155]
MTTRNRSSAIIVSASLLGAVLALSACQKQDAPPPTAAAAPAAPTTPPYTPPTAAQLSQMVAPIALFPDKLVAQVLAGATYPDQIVAANQWLSQNGALKGDILQAAEDKQAWDVSVKSLTMFPAVLSQMAANPDWTRALGDAFVNDPNDVMNAIQELRLRAQQAGNLKSSARLKVVSTARSSQSVRVEQAPEPRTVYAGAPVIPPPPQTIVIESSQPDTVYVPAYNPAVVYGPPVPVYPGYAYRPPSPVTNEVVVGALSFGVGVFVGEAISHHSDWGWHDWGMRWGGYDGGDRPAGDWQRPAVVYRNTTYVSHSTTVINRVTNNNVTVNNTRVVNNNVNNVSNVSNVNNVSHVNNVSNVRNVDEHNINSQTRIDNRREQVAPAAMSMPHFTASDARPGAMPVQHGQPPQQKMELANVHPPQAAQEENARQRQETIQKEQQAQRVQQQQQEQQRAQQERQAAHQHEQAQQNAAQQARQQAEERKTLAMKQENARPQAPAHANREENKAVHEPKPAPEKHEAAAHEHAEQKHEPARHEQDRREEDKREAEKHNG